MDNDARTTAWPDLARSGPPMGWKWATVVAWWQTHPAYYHGLETGRARRHFNGLLGTDVPNGLFDDVADGFLAAMPPDDLDRAWNHLTARDGQYAAARGHRQQLIGV